jgi:hypothetical protein
MKLKNILKNEAYIKMFNDTSHDLQVIIYKMQQNWQSYKNLPTFPQKL